MRRRPIRLIVTAVHNCSHYKRRHIIFVVFIIVLFAHTHKYVFHWLNLMRNNIPLELLHYQQILKKHGLSSTNCAVPRLDPWDKSVIKYFKKPAPLRCKTFQNNVTILHNGILMVLREYRDKSKCRCRTFEHNTGISDFDIKYDKWMDIPYDGLKITKDRFQASSIDRPSVLLFGVDSMSRSNFIRTLPKTHQQLERMGFVDLHGHVKVGDNTFVNLGAILTGKRVTATQQFKNELSDEWNIYFDNWPFIWNIFSDEGYVTLFAEDRPDIGTFNYLGWLCGFKYPPTDHYFRFLSKYDGIRSFAFHWTQDLSHDYLNAINVADEDYERFFIENEQHFNNTIVIVFSDHGHRYDAIRETVVGRLEARLPFVSILLPKQFVKKYPHTLEALYANSMKMTTQFDFHATLLNIAKGNFSFAKISKEPPRRAYDLLKVMPQTRQCFTANIPEEYCPCYNEMEIDIEQAGEAAEQLLNFVNDLLQRSRRATDNTNIKDGFTCSKLILKQIVYASLRIPPMELIVDPQVGGKIPSKGMEISYRVVVRTRLPSDALIEGVVAKDLVNNLWKVSGEIERNNKYGNTSHCVIDPLLKKLCYCIPI